MINKKIIFSFICGAALSLIFAFKTNSNSINETKDYSLARVSKMSGKYVFMQSEPINDYDVVYELKGVAFSDFESPTEIADFVLKRARKMEDKEQKPYDAVIVGSNKVDLAIKFK